MDIECPRCSYLLPEPSGYGNHKCNHCGFSLKGYIGMKNVPTRYGGLSENVEWGDYKEDSNRGREDILRYIAPGLMNNSAKTSNRGDRDTSFDIFGSKSLGTGGSRLEMDAMYNENGGALRYRESKDPVHHPHTRDRQDINVVYGLGFHHSGLVQGFGDNPPQLEEFARRDVGMDWFESCSRNPGLIRPLDYGYPEEQPSYYEPPSSFGYGRPVDYYDGVAGPHRGLEDEKADLLRQLEDLKTRIARTCDMPHQTGREVPANRNWANIDPYRGRAGVSYNYPEDVRISGKQVLGPPYMNRSQDQILFPSNYDMEMHSYYQDPRQLPGTFHEYEEPVRPQMRRRSANYAAKVSSHDTILEDNWGIDQDHKVSYQHESVHGEPPPQALAIVPGSTRTADDSYQVGPNQIRPRRTNQAGNGVATFDDLEPQSQLRRPSSYNSDHSTQGSGSHTPEGVIDASRNKQHYHPISGASTSDNLEQRTQLRKPSPNASDHSSHGSRRHPPERMVVTPENKKHYDPIMGGAPFILCLDCFEMVKIPKELRIERKTRQKVRCGACSSVILIEVKNTSLIPSLWKEHSSETNKGPLDVPNKDTSPSRRSSDARETKSDGVVDTKETYSGHNDDSNNNIECEKCEGDNMLEDDQVNTSESNDKQQVIHSSRSSSFSSNVEDSQNHVIIQRNILAPMELPLKETEPQTEPDSPLHEQFDRIFISEIEPVEEDKSYDENYENASLKKNSSIKSSYKDVSGPTEVSISLSEYPNTNVSNDSVEPSKEETRAKTVKKSKSYFGGFLKKSIRDFLEPNQVVENERPKVTVNGHPIPDDELRRAQMLAGPIQPGDYWYDYRAGFWGVIDLPCLGIIPPLIEEFKYSMPHNCAAGNTGVYVNGRELNKRDLNLLASRGLPTTTDKFYTVDISGKVVDEETGEQLRSLGRLAPTVEKAKHGFGMRVPRIS